MPTPPSAKTAQWTSDDAISLRNFLESVSGQRALIHLGEGCPELLSGGEINSILIRSGEVKGWSGVLNFFLSLTVETPETITPEGKPLYPDLDDETAWGKDNQPL